jgi:hypothetical protein
LDINGIRGNVPIIKWGGSATPQDNKDLSATILNLYNAGITISDDSLNDLSDQLGLLVEKLDEKTPIASKRVIEEKLGQDLKE